jgi:hypothetical protein
MVTQKFQQNEYRKRKRDTEKEAHEAARKEEKRLWKTIRLYKKYHLEITLIIIQL